MKLNTKLNFKKELKEYYKKNKNIVNELYRKQAKIQALELEIIDLKKKRENDWFYFSQSMENLNVERTLKQRVESAVDLTRLCKDQRPYQIAKCAEELLDEHPHAAGKLVEAVDAYFGEK